MNMAEEDPKGKRKLIMGKFNCEQVQNISWCGQIQLRKGTEYKLVKQTQHKEHLV